MASAPPAYDEQGVTFQSLMQKHEIHDEFAKKLRQLEKYHVVFVCDDSSSMDTPLTPTGAYDSAFSRWEELTRIVTMAVEVVVSLLQRNGVDIYFMNRPPLLNTRSLHTVIDAFSIPPEGYTPMVATLNKVLQASQSLEKKLLIILATDGEPTNASNKVDTGELVKWVAEHKDTNITFVACTDEKDCVSYLNKLDNKYRHVDVCDDYQSERREVQAKRGAKFNFSRGDYLVKVLVGSIDQELNNLDGAGGGCCVVQ